MASGFGKVAQALAIGIGAGMEGYGKGSLQVALNAREEYQQRLKQQWAKEESVEERAYKTEESEKDRAHDFSILEKKEEYDTAQQERALQNQITLSKMRTASKGSGSGTSAITRTITDAEGTVWGITKTGTKIDLGIKGKAGSSGSSSKDPTALKLARFQAEAKYGPEATDAQVAEFLSKDKAKDDTVKPKDIAKAMNDAREAMEDPLNRDSRAFKKLSPEEQQEVLAKRVIGTYESAGAKLPEEFTSRYQKGQESKAEAPQAQAVEAPPTSTQGDKPTTETAPGSGTEADPYVANTPEQQMWVRDHAPPGAYVVVNGRVKRKPTAKTAP